MVAGILKTCVHILQRVTIFRGILVQVAVRIVLSIKKNLALTYGRTQARFSLYCSFLPSEKSTRRIALSPATSTSSSWNNYGSSWEEWNTGVIVIYETALPTHDPSRFVATMRVDTPLPHVRMASSSVLCSVRVYVQYQTYSASR